MRRTISAAEIMGGILLDQQGDWEAAERDRQNRQLAENRERERVLFEGGWVFAGNITPDNIGGPYQKQRAVIEARFPGSQFERSVDVMSVFDDDPEVRELRFCADYSVLYASPVE